MRIFIFSVFLSFFGALVARDTTPFAYHSSRDPIRFIEFNSSGSIPLATWRYGIRFYVYWKSPRESSGTVRFLDGGCASYTERNPRYGFDIGAHVIQPVYEYSNWMIEYSARWSSFRRATYQPESYRPDRRVFLENLALSVSVAHDLQQGKITRAGCALWLYVPQFGIPVRLIRRVIKTQLFVQANVPLNGQLPEYISPLQGGVEFSFTFRGWIIKRYR